ncbi:hypothetical protein MMC25_005976 [Agyrium rufum]|nr:hypothetical protein [Agyrium rufum]
MSASIVYFALLLLAISRACDTLLTFAHAAPVPPAPMVGWTSEPNGRGTFGIITSCVATLSLCVWSSMHLNVPTKESSEISRWMNRFLWLFWGIFGPELVVWIAWRQFDSARTLRNLTIPSKEQAEEEKRLEAVVTQEKQSGLKRHGSEAAEDAFKLEVKEEEAWTLEQGHYATMGGFIFDTASISLREIIPYNPKRRYLTLTARGIALLHACGHLPRVSLGDIKDKSKSDAITKIIALGQATWMVIQILGRVAQHLPVTQLEINTMSHVVCAFGIYLLWWHKPQGITEPTKVEGEWVQPLVAYMYMSSEVSGWKTTKTSILRKAPKAPEFRELQYNELMAVPPRDPQSPGILQGGASGEKEWAIAEMATKMGDASTPQIQIEAANDTSSSYRKRQSSPSSGYSSSARERHLQNIGTGNEIQTDYKIQPLKLTGSLSRRGTEEKVSGLGDNPHNTNTDPVQIESVSTDTTQAARWAAATRAISRYPALREKLEPDSDTGLTPVQNILSRSDTDTSGVSIFLPKTEKYLVHAVANWPANAGLMNSINGLVKGTLCWMSSIVFGGINLAAWSGDFPTPAERWIWRISALWIACSGILWVLINLGARMSDQFNAYWERVTHSQVSKAEYAVIGFIASVCGIAYLGSRLYLVVEAFVGLRMVQAGTYDTPQWSNFLPHVS